MILQDNKLLVGSIQVGGTPSAELGCLGFRRLLGGEFVHQRVQADLRLPQLLYEAEAVQAFQGTGQPGGSPRTPIVGDSR